MNFCMKHLLNVSPQTERLAKASAEAVLLSHVTRTHDLTPHNFQCKRPHEPRLSSVSELSAALAAVTERKSGGLADAELWHFLHLSGDSPHICSIKSCTPYVMMTYDDTSCQPSNKVSLLNLRRCNKILFTIPMWPG